MSFPCPFRLLSALKCVSFPPVSFPPLMDRGDIYHLNLNPTVGREQAGPRVVLIVSPREFNQLGTPLVYLITQGCQLPAKGDLPFPSAAPARATQGIVLCQSAP